MFCLNAFTSPQVWANNEGWEDLYSDPDSDPDPDSYHECGKYRAHVLAYDAHNCMIDAFPIAARELFHREPNGPAYGPSSNGRQIRIRDSNNDGCNAWMDPKSFMSDSWRTS